MDHHSARLDPYQLAARLRLIATRRSRYHAGLWAECYAALFMILKGYRILARRYRAASGEIDLVAVRGRTVCFVEVKARLTLEAAEASITSRQSRRMRRAADQWIGNSPRYQDFEQRFDAVYVLPGQLPRHLAGCA
jgi:putative endonuclease